MTKFHLFKPRRLYLGLSGALCCLLLTIPGWAQNERPYSKGPLQWEKDFKLITNPDTGFDAFISCDIKFPKKIEMAKSSGGQRGFPPNKCIACLEQCDPKKQGKRLFNMVNDEKCRLRVIAFMTKNRSSKPKDKAKRTAPLLAHEQGHFDLWEATARALEKEINEKKYCLTALNCSLAGGNAFRAHISSLFAAAKEKGVNLNNKYDRETDHSRNRKKQKEWEKKIKKLLSIKGGPSWDQVTSPVSTEAQGGEGKKPKESNYPVTPLTFSEVTLHIPAWSHGPLTLVLPPMIFENHGGTFSRLWASDTEATMIIFDENLNPWGTADFGAFYGNETDTEFRATLSGPTAFPSISDLEPFPIDPDTPLILIEDSGLETTQITIKFSEPLGEKLTDLGPFEIFNANFAVGKAPGEPTSGDINYDGLVDAADIEALIQALNGEEVLILPHTGDLNGDGEVTQADLEVLMDQVNNANPDGGMD